MRSVKDLMTCFPVRLTSRDLIDDLYKFHYKSLKKLYSKKYVCSLQHATSLILLSLMGAVLLKSYQQCTNI